MSDSALRRSRISQCAALLMFWCQIIPSSAEFLCIVGCVSATPGPYFKNQVPPSSSSWQQEMAQTAASWEGKDKMDPGSDTGASQGAKYSVQPPWTCRQEQAGTHGKRWGSRLKPGESAPTPNTSGGHGEVLMWTFSGTFFETCTPSTALCLFLIYTILAFLLLPHSFFGSGLSRLPGFCPPQWRQRTAGYKFLRNDASNTLKTVIALQPSLLAL